MIIYVSKSEMITDLRIKRGGRGGMIVMVGGNGHE